MERIGTTDDNLVIVTMTQEEFRAAHTASVAVAHRLKQMAREIELLWPDVEDLESVEEESPSKKGNHAN